MTIIRSNRDDSLISINNEKKRAYLFGYAPSLQRRNRGEKSSCIKQLNETYFALFFFARQHLSLKKIAIYIKKPTLSAIYAHFIFESN
ncbi:hypothetical protein [Neisseria yangbaofengii]|uniref:hypothetical protein n=1 Tax=Neisseria yangbaofengii TaxID=2709396 RepID=UPI0013ECCCE9|nr:hypothetical protein [Neisseria yangbaofengii]